MNVRKYIEDDSIAEDILQEVFIALWINRDKLSEEGVVGWLFVVSSNKAISFLKQDIQQRMTLSLDSEIIPEPYYDDADNVQYEVENLQWSILQEAIASLPEKRRTVFRLCKLEGHSYKDAAEKLGISVESVKEYLKKSNKSIKCYIEENYRSDDALIQGLLLIVLFSI